MGIGHCLFHPSLSILGWPHELARHLAEAKGSSLSASCQGSFWHFSFHVHLSLLLHIAHTFALRKSASRHFNWKTKMSYWKKGAL